MVDKAKKGPHEIGWAVKEMYHGERVRRAGWNGKGMALWMVWPAHYTVAKVPGDTLLPWIGMRTADGRFVPWLCSQTDLLATDWELADGGVQA